MVYYCFNHITFDPFHELNMGNSEQLRLQGNGHFRYCRVLILDVLYRVFYTHTYIYIYIDIHIYVYIYI